MLPNELFELLKRDAVSIYSQEELLAKLNSGRRLKIKLGADPSRPDLHLGHSVVLRKLKLFQDLGHEIIFVIGDFTGMIGDPSGKSKTRVPLTSQQTRANAKSYFEQVSKILDREKTVITYNSDWLGKMDFADVLSLAGKYTLARILERDDFSKRFTDKRPIGLHELFYPLMQGYDSVALKADIEIGGTDQTFNLLVGRELQQDYGMEQQTVITFPLLAGLDGIEKMSKSLNNYIGIDEAPELMFEKCMKVPDTLLRQYFRLATDLAEPVFDRLISSNIREAHFVFAREIVRLYHGAEAVFAAEQRYHAIAKGVQPDEMEIKQLSKGEITLAELIRMAGLALSNSEARRLISGGGIKINGKTVSDSLLVLPGTGELVLCRGKYRFVKVVFE